MAVFEIRSFALEAEGKCNGLPVPLFLIFIILLPQG